MTKTGRFDAGYDCCYCSGEASFTVFDKLGEHMRYNHGKNYFYCCPRCSFQNRFAQMLKRHLTHNHQIPRDKISMQSLEKMRMDVTGTASVFNPPPPPLTRK